MPYIFSNDGLTFSWRDKNDNSPLQAGEIAFENRPSEAEILAAFPNYNTAKQSQSYATEARLALNKSDVTVLRCIEVGTAVPAAWASYRAALRVIIGGGAGPLPNQPSYPSGT